MKTTDSCFWTRRSFKYKRFIRLVSHQFIHAFVSPFQVKIKLLTIFQSLQINEILLPNEIHQFKVLKKNR